jgi:serine/threonine protein kinase/protocatechuate 3,4-dioxygenase beta subunit
MPLLKFDEYKVLADADSRPQVLGEGATATIYVARHTETQVEVALKVFKDEVVGKMQAQCCGPLMQAKSQHLIKVFSAKRSAEGPYIMAMEKLSGRTLAEKLSDSGRLDWRTALSFAAQVASGLVDFFPHVHLDLKPENIFLTTEVGTPETRLVLLDCGAFVRGTPAYSPPEQLLDDHIPDSPSVDVYALGSCIWEMLTGCPPFGRHVAEEDLRAAGEAKLSGKLDFGTLGDVPGALIDAMRRMLAIQPRERFQHPQELLDAILAVLRKEETRTAFYPQAPDSSLPTFTEAQVGNVDSIIKVCNVTNGVTLYNGQIPQGRHQVGIAQIIIPNSAQSEGLRMRQEIEAAAKARLLGIRDILGVGLEDETTLHVLTEPWGRDDFLNSLRRSNMPNPQRDGLSRGAMDLFLFLARLVDECERRGWQSLFLSSAVISLPDAKSAGVWYAPGHRVWVPMGNPVNFWSNTATAAAGGTVAQVESLKGPLHRQLAALFYEFVGGTSPVAVFSEGGSWTPLVPPKDIRDGLGFCRLLQYVHGGRRNISGRCEEWMSEIAEMVRPTGSAPTGQASPKPSFVKAPEPILPTTADPASPISKKLDQRSLPNNPSPRPTSVDAPVVPENKKVPPDPGSALPGSHPTGSDGLQPRGPWKPTSGNDRLPPQQVGSIKPPLKDPGPSVPAEKSSNRITWVLLAALVITLMLKWETWKPLFQSGGSPPPVASAGRISGTVSSDIDGDGRADAGLAGVRLELQHSDGTPVDGDSSTSGVQPTLTTTDANGSYHFDQVPAGKYFIAEAQPPGYDSVSDSDGGDPDVHGDNGGLTLLAGATVSGVDFLERAQTTPGRRQSSPPQPHPATGAIAGFVLADTDGDGKVESASGIDGVSIELLDDNNQTLKRTQTNAQGGYEFKDLNPGAYQVRQTQPSNHTSLTTAGDGGDLDVLGDQRRIVVISGRTVSGQDFHEQAPYTPKPVVTRSEMNELHDTAIYSYKLRADWIDALAKAVQYGERFKSSPGSLPQDLRTYAELLCFRMAEDSTKEGWGAQIPLLKKAAAPPLETTLAFYLLGNQCLEDANTLLRSKDITAANSELKQAVDYLDEGIKRGQPLCKAKKGALLTTRSKAYQDAGYQGVVVPGGTPEDGLRLMDEAYNELALDYLAVHYKSSNANLQERSKLFEAQLAYAMGLCWQFGIGTGIVPVPPEKSYASLSLMEKRAFDNASNQFDQAIAKNKKFAPSYGRWLVLQVQGLGPVKDEQAWRKKWTATMISRARDGVDLGDGFCEYWLARYQWTSHPSIAIPLMKQAALPGKETEQDAGNWLRKNGVK